MRSSWKQEAIILNRGIGLSSNHLLGLCWASVREWKKLGGGGAGETTSPGLLSLLELADMSLFPLTLSDASPRSFNYCLHLAVRFPLPTQITFWSVNAFVTSITHNFCTIWPEIQHVCWMGCSFVFFARYLDLDYIYNLIITH